MSRNEFSGTHVSIRHTVEHDQPHNNTGSEHFHDTQSIMILISGSGVYCRDGNRYRLTDGDIVLTGKNTIHSFRFEEQGTHERLTICFSDSVLSPVWEYELPVMDLFRRPERYSHCPREQYDPEEIGTIVSELCQLTDTRSDSHTAMEDARAHIRVLQLLFSLYGSFEACADCGAGNVGQNADVTAICRYIKDHLMENLSYASIQSRFFVSRYFLSTVFRQNTGLTLTDYILHTRLLKVHELVHQGSGIANAAQMAGFKNYSHFYKEFKKHKNVSPREYYM